MRLCVRNALLVTLNDRDEILDNGALVVDGRHLAYVGPAAQAPAGPFDRVIDVRRLIALPGFVNAHCHSPANLFRGRLASWPWRRCIFKW